MSYFFNSSLVGEKNCEKYVMIMDLNIVRKIISNTFGPNSRRSKLL